MDEGFAKYGVEGEGSQLIKHEVLDFLILEILEGKNEWNLFDIRDLVVQ